MRPFIRTVVFRRILAPLLFTFSFVNAQQQPAPPPAPAPACSQADTCKAVDNANAAAANATGAVTNAQQAAGAAQNAAGQADESAKAAKDAADAAAKAATDANSAAATAAKSFKSASATASGSLPRRALGKRAPIDDYVPCIFDDGEIRDMRTLEPPPTPPVKKGEPLDASGAEAVASTVQQVVNQVAPPAVPDTKSSKNKNKAIQLPDKDTQDFAQSITPDMFIGQLPENVSNTLQSFADEKHFSKILDPETKQLNPDVASQVAQNVNKLEKPGVAATQFNRPDDVSCSFSVLQWKETSDTFGRRVANQYVGIEVNVRNLNQQNEFLIHDIQIAVDTGLNRAQFGRFQAARDKLVVRNVAQRGQTEDRRNLVINTLQAVGAVAGGASTAVTQGLSNTVQATDLSSAVAIFQGPFITGVINIFPDHTLEHINHINDLAFSASSTSKTVVPVQGSVPLITFLSEKPLEQLPFSRCGTSVPKKLWYSLYTYESTGESQEETNPGSSTYQFCKLDAFDAYDNPLPQPGSLQPNYYMQAYPFRKWKAAALDVLQHRIFVVIGGVHIKEVQKQPTLSSIACDPGKDTTIDLSKISGPNATCTLKGNDLDLISQVSLQNATDSNDKIQVQGTSSVSGDTTEAAILFLKNDLLKLKGTTYKLYYSLKGGAPQPTSITVTLKQTVSMNPTSIDFGSQAQNTAKAQTVTLTNNGSATLTFTPGISVTGKDVSDYSQTNTCSTSLAAGKNCVITVTFKPTATGVRSASVNISDNDPSSPQTVELTGSGTQTPPADAGH